MLFIKRVFVTFQAAAFLALVSLTPPGLVFATPFSAMDLKNHTSFREADPHSKTFQSTSNSNSSHPRVLLPSSTRSVEPRQELGAILGRLSSGAGDLKTCSESCLHAPDSQQWQSTSTVSSFYSDLLDVQGSLQKGEAFYDKNNNLETILRDLINYTKQLLNSVHALVQCDWLLGVPLGPLVWEIKCIIDWLLDFCENASDASLNALVPLLNEILGLCGTCRNNICLLGLGLPGL
ncbi:hypothetical protein GYMLUDRAFT_33119 [Collybiopsis luxurians FD-317 M1]|nr:hypothetical protein GYMLUDRAFT_33119 [Collybiopsis luxurians FD-317 M1]